MTGATVRGRGYHRRLAILIALLATAFLTLFIWAAIQVLLAEPPF